MANDPSQYPKQVPCTPDGTPLYTSPPSGSGGGGAVTVADGADVAQGNTGDTTAANTVIGRLKNLLSRIPAALGANGGLVVEGVAGGVAQPVSAATLPLPVGAATAAKQPALGTAGTAATDVISVQGIASGTVLPVSATSLPLPTGAATALEFTDGSQKTQVVNGANVLGVDSAGAIPLQSGGISGAAVPARTTQVGGSDGTNLRPFKTGTDGTQVIDVQKATPVVVTGTGAAVNDTPIAVTEVMGRWVTVQITGTFVATYTWEGSNDNTNWSPLSLTSVGLTSTSSLVTLSTLTTAIFTGACPTRYFRVRVSAYTSGTITATAIISPFPTFNNPLAVDSELPAAAALADAATPLVSTVKVGTIPFGMTGSATSDILRTPNIFKTATATASGDTAVWTPTSGKKFRLMAYQIQVTADAATSGGAVIDVVLRDSTTATAAAYSVLVPAVAGTAFGNSASSGWVTFGNGLLSAAANNVLNVNLSAALTSGKVRVVAIGTEE